MGSPDGYELLRNQLRPFATNEVAVFRQSDDSLEVTFCREGNRIFIETNVAPGARPDLTATDVNAGAREFVEHFANEASTRVPDALRWKDLAILEYYRGGTWTT
jgi:hypothetical protein